MARGFRKSLEQAVELQNNTGTLIPGGSIRVLGPSIGSILGISIGDISPGEVGTYAIRGCWTIPKAVGAGTAIDQFETVNWSPVELGEKAFGANSPAHSPVMGDVLCVGFADRAAGDDDDHVDVWLGSKPPAWVQQEVAEPAPEPILDHAGNPVRTFLLQNRVQAYTNVDTGTPITLFATDRHGDYPDGAPARMGVIAVSGTYAMFDDIPVALEGVWDVPKGSQNSEFWPGYSANYNRQNHRVTSPNIAAPTAAGSILRFGTAVETSGFGSFTVRLDISTPGIFVGS